MMRWQAYQEVHSIVVCFKLWHWRMVVFHHLQDLRDTGRAPLREVQFFKELTDSTVAIAATDCVSFSQVHHLDGTVRAGKTQNHQIIWGDPHFDGFPHFVGAMVNCIDHRLFDGDIGKVPETLGLGPVGVFDNRLFEIVCLDITQCVTGDTGKRAFKGLLVKAIPAWSFREPDHVDLCCREEPSRVIIEKEQANVLRQSRRGIRDTLRTGLRRDKRGGLALGSCGTRRARFFVLSRELVGNSHFRFYIALSAGLVWRQQCHQKNTGKTMSYWKLLIPGFLALMLALLWLSAGSLLLALGEEDSPGIVVWQGENELHDDCDLLPGNGALDVFYLDQVEIQGLCGPGASGIVEEDMVWEFEEGPVVHGHDRFRFLVGGNVTLPGGDAQIPGPVFLEFEPTHIMNFSLIFTALGLEGEPRQELLFQVHPYARASFAHEFVRHNEEYQSNTTLVWRGLESQAVDSMENWSFGKVFVGLELVDAHVPAKLLPRNSWLDFNYRIKVFGPNLSNGKPGFISIGLELPFSRWSVEHLGVFEELVGDVVAYRYDKVTRLYGPAREDDLDGLRLDDGRNLLQGQIPCRKGLFTTKNHWDRERGEEYQYLELELGLAVKSIWTGEKRPELVLSKLEFDRSHLLIDNSVNLTVTVQLRGVVFVNQDVEIRFLDHFNNTLASTRLSFASNCPRTQQIRYRKFIDDPLWGFPHGGSVEHNFTVVIDAGHHVWEHDESNNRLTQNLTVVEYQLEGYESGHVEGDKPGQKEMFLLVFFSSLGTLGGFLFWALPSSREEEILASWGPEVQVRTWGLLILYSYVFLLIIAVIMTVLEAVDTFLLFSSPPLSP